MSTAPLPARTGLRHATGLALSLALVQVLALAPADVRATHAQDDKPNSPPNTLPDAALLQALRVGGIVIYFRHGQTDLSTQDTDRNNLAHCATQRQLSARGREEMAEIGQAFRQLGIRVSAARSSPYCRAAESARLAFGEVTLDPDLAHTVTADDATAKRQAQALRRLLALPPAAGSNSVLAGHAGNLQEATGVWPSPEGAAIVFKPDGQGGFNFVATVHPAQWARWLPRAKPVERGERAARPEPAAAK